MPELPDYSAATEEDLLREANLPVSDGEKVLAAKADEWAKAGDVDKALDCARASLHLYHYRIERRDAARLELASRRENARHDALVNAAKTAPLL